MKFQNPCKHCLEVMLCIKKRNGRTHGRTDGQMHKHPRSNMPLQLLQSLGHKNVPEAICPSNFFEVGGINIVEKRRNCSLGAISPLFHNILLLVVRFSCLNRDQIFTSR